MAIRGSTAGRVLALLCLAAPTLGGCVDQFTAKPVPGALAYVGESTGADTAERPNCGPLAFRVAVSGDRLDGRAEPVGWSAEPEIFRPYGRFMPAGVTDAVSRWYVEGVVAADDTVELETRMQAPYWHGARPNGVWRGSREGDTIVLHELPPFCGREVRLRRG